MKFRVLHYRPDWDKRFLDNGISGWTLFWNGLAHLNDLKTLWKLRSSHCEIWLPDNEWNTYCMVNKDTKDKTLLGTLYTSTMGQAGDKKVNGCVCRPASEILTTPRRWYYYEYEVCEQAFDYMKTWMDLQVANNVQYDMWDITKFFLPIRKQDVDDFQKICSGFSWIALYKAAIMQQLNAFQELTFRLVYDNQIDDLFSPLLMSYKQYKAGAKAIDLETGKVLIK